MEIRLCKRDELNLLLSFIKDYWSEKHIFVLDNDLLKWQHANTTGTFNFLIAMDDSNNIQGIYGFIPQSHFDRHIVASTGRNEAWGAIWKVLPDCKIPGLGVLLLKKTADQFDFIGGIGLSEKSKAIYRLLHCKTGVLKQYYVLNDRISDYSIASVIDLSTRNEFHCKNCNVTVRVIEKIQGITLQHAYYPCKTLEYVTERYVKHPYYRYFFLGCFVSELLKCILICRSVRVGSRSCIRIVDAFGDLRGIIGLGEELKRYIFQSDSIEYIDILNAGIDADFFTENGFEMLKPETGVIIPNYFEPFERSNVVLDYFYISKDKGIDYVFFKGDGDQDRPNLITSKVKQ